ncbi:MAG: arsenate reductase (azurin) large subunit [Chloroflexota bacterium]|nr:arsenate reductase (azurin) large subunit [Chloroflexota bacterium]
MATERATDSIPLPPPNADVKTMTCQYCVVGCGYKSYVWPTTEPDGTPEAAGNALGADYPVGVASGQWISPGMYNVIRKNDGRDYNVAIVPDRECVVNGGNYSPRGGSNALGIWSPYGPTQDRLHSPMLKVGGAQQRITWDAALQIMAEIYGHSKEAHGPASIAVRFYAYQYYENTYPITKFFFGDIGTPNGALHNRASMGGETTALEDTGVSTWGTAYEDGHETQTLVAWGANHYENRDVWFTQHITPYRVPIVSIDPRRTFTAAYGETVGGVHLQLVPGTDVVLANAISRLILEQDWGDPAFVANMATRADIELETENWRRLGWGMTPDEFRAYLMADDTSRLPDAAAITGVPEDKIRKATELIAMPNEDGSPRKTLLTLEKGAIWSINYETVGAIANIALLTGSSGQPGRGVTRGGGHQEGYVGGAPYPLDAATDTYQGNKIPNYIDQHIADGEVRIYHVIGANPLGMTNSAQWSRQTIQAKQAVTPSPQTADTDEVIANFKRRIDQGGLVLIAQDIFPNLTTENADLVLPAAGWGEMPGHRWNGERRLRISDRFMDPPGEAMPDWWVVAQVARRMGFQGYDWPDENAIFEEAAGAPDEFARDINSIVGDLEQNEPEHHEDYVAVLVAARQRGISAHDVMRQLGTNGVQLPARLDADGNVVGTPRLHSNGQWDTASGKPMFIKAGWDTAEAIWDKLKPDTAAGEFWLTNGRIEEIWQTMYTDLRKPFVRDRWPTNIVEISPEDAGPLGVKSGDLMSLSSDRVARNTDDGFDSGTLTAAAYVSDIVPRGVLWTNFAYPDQWMNNVAPRFMHPVNPVTPFKLARVTITKIGETDLADRMSFLPRNIAPATEG